MAPTMSEKESRKIAQLLVYVHEKLNWDCAPEVTAAAKATYGDPDRLHILTDQLCDICRTMSEARRERVIYDGHNPQARQLADWWDAHQVADIRRNKQLKVSYHEFVRFCEDWLKCYPADIFDGSSGDPGPEFVVAIRDAVERLKSRA